MADEADQTKTGGKTGSPEYSLFELLQFATQGGYASGVAKLDGAKPDDVFQAYEDNGGKYVGRKLAELKQHLAPEDYDPLYNAIHNAQLRASAAAAKRLNFSLKASLDQPEIDALSNLSDKLRPLFPEIQDEVATFNAPSEQHPRTAKPAEGKTPQFWGGNLNVSPAAAKPAPAPQPQPDAPASNISLFNLLNLSANVGYSDGIGLSQNISQDAREAVASTLGELSGRLSPDDFSFVNGLAGSVTERAKQAAAARENFSLKRALEESEITALTERPALPAAFRDFEKATGYFQAPTNDHPRSSAPEQESSPGIKAGDLPLATQQTIEARTGSEPEPVAETDAGKGASEAKDPVVEEPVTERDDGQAPPVDPTSEQRAEKPVDATAKPAESPAEEPSSDKKGNKGLIAAATAIVTAIAVGLGLKKGDDTNQQPASNRQEAARRAASTAREKIDGATGKAREGIDRALGSEHADRAKALGSSLVNNFKDMSGVNKTAAGIGAGMALEGTVSAVNNIRNGRGGKRICFALGRAAVGGLMTYATYQAANQNMNVGTFVQKELQRRLGRSNTQGQGV